MGKIRAGQFRHKITIQSSASAQGTYGGESITWSTFDIAFAMIESMVGREFLGSGKVSGDTTHKFWIRINKDKGALRRDMRIIFNNTIFDFTSPPIRPDERENVWIVMAKVHD